MIYENKWKNKCIDIEKISTISMVVQIINATYVTNIIGSLALLVDEKQVS